ncbi:MAG: hypothetical protein RIC85_04470 [Gammaproteobacteria bacterium]
MATVLEEATASLKRIQDFDPESLPRVEDLGNQLSFKDAVQPARRTIELYRQLSLQTLPSIADKQLDQLKNHADADFNRFDEILKFEVATENAPGRRDTLISQLRDAYQGTFNILHPLIAYGMTRAVDFQSMENDARAMIQSVQDQVQSITEGLETSRQQAEQILEDIRNVAAEQGVSQQAIYFRDESDRHLSLADSWRKKTVNLALLLGAYAIVALIIHKIPFLTPLDSLQSIQLITGKILIFAVIAYMLILSARNFLSHEHNAIVNKHRQNALMTYTALVDAAKEEDHSDIVLLQAAQCIFSPQETGYTKQGGIRPGASAPVLELLRRSGNAGGD